MDATEPTVTITPATPPKRGRKAKPVTESATTTAAVTVTPIIPRVSVLEKRLAGGNPFGVESVPIPLKDPGWVTYIANGSRSDGRLYEMKAVKGWEPVLVTDVTVRPEEIGFHKSPDGYLCRGEKGHEVVFKMRRADWDRLQQVKTAQNMKTIGSSAKTKDALAEATGAQFGDEAGQFMKDHFVGEVRDWRAPEDL